MRELAEQLASLKPVFSLKKSRNRPFREILGELLSYIIEAPKTAKTNQRMGYRKLHTLDILTHSVLRILEKCLLLCNRNEGIAGSSYPAKRSF